MNLRALLRHHLSHEAHPFIQFLKYAFAGGIATATHIFFFFLFGFFVFPCVTQDDILVRLLHLAAPVVEETLRVRYANYSNFCAFLIANTVCYFLNRLFVFKPGRHHVILEFLLFLGVSAISATLGAAIMSVLIGQFGIQTTYAFVANIFTSLAINYALRKYFVFKG